MTIPENLGISHSRVKEIESILSDITSNTFVISEHLMMIDSHFSDSTEKIMATYMLAKFQARVEFENKLLQLN